MAEIAAYTQLVCSFQNECGTIRLARLVARRANSQRVFPLCYFANDPDKARVSGFFIFRPRNEGVDASSISAF